MALIDSFGRPVTYLRLSVTDRCDFRCRYCMPPGYRGFLPRAELLTAEEMLRLARASAWLGISRVRLTGGEPLVREDILEIVGGMGKLSGIEDLSLSTNGSQLDRLALPLRSAGVSRINVSLDSLDGALFHQLTRGNLSQVLAGLEAAKAAGMNPIKLNMVVMGGVNDHEVEAMVDFSATQGFTLRFIETMPVGASGADQSRHFVDLREIEQRLRKRFHLEPAAVRGAGPARYWHLRGTKLVVGFITPLSQHFCATCNRIRVSADGVLYLCLGREDRVDLRQLLRAGAEDAEIAQAMAAAVARKPREHHFTLGLPAIGRVMAKTGG